MKRRSTKRAGFTLVELMVALTISGIVISSMYFVSAASTRHFQVQHQAANMQSGMRFAMLQLKRDVLKAGYHSTAMAREDLNSCQPPNWNNDPVLGGDGWIAAISSFRNDVMPNIVDPTGNNAANGFTRDEITFLGNYATANEYPAIMFDPAMPNRLQINIDPNTIHHSLQVDFGWDQVTGAPVPAVNVGMVMQAFPRNGMIRITTTNHRRHYAVLTTAPTIAGNLITINFQPGIMGACALEVDNGWVAPIQYVRYGVAMSAANTIDSERAGAQIPQLQRTQRLPTAKNQIMPGSIVRNVVDYVAAFNLAFTTTAATGLGQPDDYDIGITTNAENTINNDPDLVRAITMTLAVRAPSTDPGMRFLNCGNMRCFQIDPQGGPGGPAARVRWQRTELFLPNLAIEGNR